jgi:hypothetical protein
MAICIKIWDFIYGTTSQYKLLLLEDIFLPIGSNFKSEETIEFPHNDLCNIFS